MKIHFHYDILGKEYKAEVTNVKRHTGTVRGGISKAFPEIVFAEQRDRVLYTGVVKHRGKKVNVWVYEFSEGIENIVWAAGTILNEDFTPNKTEDYETSTKTQNEPSNK